MTAATRLRGRYRFKRNTSVPATFVDAICAWERATASFLRRATGCTGGVGPQAVRWKDLGASHYGRERRLDKESGVQRVVKSPQMANGDMAIAAGASGGARPDPLAIMCQHVNCIAFQSEARSLSLDHCRRLISLRSAYRIIFFSETVIWLLDPTSA